MYSSPPGNATPRLRAKPARELFLCNAEEKLFGGAIPIGDGREGRWPGALRKLFLGLFVWLVFLLELAGPRGYLSPQIPSYFSTQ